MIVIFQQLSLLATFPVSSQGRSSRVSRGVSKSYELDICSEYDNSINVSHNFKIVN